MEVVLKDEFQVDCKFIHFRSNILPGAVTVAYRFIRETSLTVGISFCSPREKQHGKGRAGYFNKRIGNDIAKKRLDSNPLHIEFKAKPTMKECMDVVVKLLSKEQTWEDVIPQPTETSWTKYPATWLDPKGDVRVFIHTRHGTSWPMNIMPWVYDFMQVTTFVPKPRKPRPDVVWLYFYQGEDELVPDENNELNKNNALRREWWYEAGNTYVYQDRKTADEPWSIVYGEYEDKGYPKWVAEELLAYGLHENDIRPEGVELEW